MIYKLRVEPGFPLPNMVKQATNRAICTTGAPLCILAQPPRTTAAYHRRVCIRASGAHRRATAARMRGRVLARAPALCHAATFFSLRDSCLALLVA